MRAFIYVGGSIAPDNITEHPQSGDLTIAADSGLHNAKKLGERIDIVLGDLDSVGDFTLPNGAEQITFPPEKDLTDAQLAVEAHPKRTIPIWRWRSRKGARGVIVTLS